MDNKTEAQIIWLFHPGYAPFIGRNSTCHPTALLPGEAAESTNLRRTGRVLRVRDGSAAYLNKSGMPSGTVVGMWMSDPYKIVAVDTGSATNLYYYDTGLTSWQFCGGFTSTGQNVVFCPFSTLTCNALGGYTSTKKYMLAQNGVDTPKVSPISAYPSVPSFDDVVSLAPCDIKFAKAQYKPYASFSVVSASAIASNSGAMTSTNTGTGGEKRFTLTMPAGVASGDYAGIAFSSTARAVVGSDLSQLHIVVKATAAQLEYYTQSCKIKVRSGSNNYTVHDPQNGVGRLAVYQISGDYQQLVIETSDAYLSSVGDITGLPANTYDRLVFEHNGLSKPAANVDIDVMYAGFGAKVQYGTSFGVGFFQEGTCSESKGVVCAESEAPKISAYGGCTLGNLALVRNAGCYYACDVQARKPFGSVLPYTRLNIFASEVGSSTYFIDEASPGTNIASDASGTLYTVAVTKITPNNYVMPDGLVERIPVASVAASVNSRLALGVDDTILFSDRDYPNRFRYAQRFDNGVPDVLSGVRVPINGENVTQIATVSGAALAGDAVYAFTARGLYSFDTTDATQIASPRRVAEHGTISPLSVASYQNTLIWVDPMGQVRNLQVAMLPSMSVDIIDADLTSIPSGYLSKAVAWVWNDRYYLAITPPGTTTNTHVHVYDFRQNYWTKDVSAWDVARCHVATDGSSHIPLFMNKNTNKVVYQYEKPGQTTENGSNIPVELNFGYVSGGYASTVQVGRLLWSGDSHGSASLTINRRKLKSGADVSVSGVLSLVDSGVIVDRYDQSASAAQPGADDAGVQIRISGTLPGAYKVYAIGVEARTSKRAPDVAT